MATDQGHSFLLVSYERPTKSMEPWSDAMRLETTGRH